MRGDGDGVDIDTGGRRQADCRIAAEWTFIDERGAVGIRLLTASAITRCGHGPRLSL
jgi:hypothetical protein